MLANKSYTFRVNKGTVVFVPILAINRSKAIWGEDAYEFKYVVYFGRNALKIDFFRPERWSKLPPEVKSIHSVYNSGFTFTSGPKVSLMANESYNIRMFANQCFIFLVLCWLPCCRRNVRSHQSTLLTQIFNIVLSRTKVVIYTLVRNFRFDLAVDQSDIETSILGITRPVIRGKAYDGAQLPLRVTLIEDGNNAPPDFKCA